MNDEKGLAYKKKRIFDQMASMHFKLSDEYEFKSKFEDAIEIFLSVLLCSLVFFDFEKFGCAQLKNPTLIMGFISIALFAFTLLKQRFNHKKLGEQHYLAGKMYTHAKLEVDAMIEEWKIEDIPEIEIVQYFQDNFSELNELVQIPEKKFIRLKHAHQTKMEFSKFLDNHKREYLWICRLKFRFGNQQNHHETDDDVVL